MNKGVGIVQQDKIWEVIEKNLTEEQVITILTNLGSLPPRRDSDNNLIFQSVCHNSDSWKLCYYIETHSFFCYRDWESFNLFSLVMQVKECDFKTALKYVCEILNIRIDTFSAPTQGFVSNYTKADWDIFERFDRLQNGIKTKEELESYNENILNLYSDLYYEGWIEENISIESMKKYHIKYDIVNERIIIPHFDINNNLIGIRCRNLNPMAEAKYCPIYIETVPYTHSLSCNLYGLNRNKEVIKSMKKVMIVESEKSTLQAETYFPNNNFVVACCGSSISNEQIQLLLTLGVEEVILGMDWDFEILEETDEKYKLYKKKILKLCQKLVPYFTVKVLLPPDANFIYKCSPSDLGKDYLLRSMKNKITVTYDTICNEKELEKLEKGE
jgi:hypothetical protein